MSAIIHMTYFKHKMVLSSPGDTDIHEYIPSSDSPYALREHTGMVWVTINDQRRTLPDWAIGLLLALLSN